LLGLGCLSLGGDNEQQRRREGTGAVYK